MKLWKEAQQAEVKSGVGIDMSHINIQKGVPLGTMIDLTSSEHPIVREYTDMPPTFKIGVASMSTL